MNIDILLTEFARSVNEVSKKCVTSLGLNREGRFQVKQNNEFSGSAVKYRP